jgi:hypothetical protein
VVTTEYDDIVCSHLFSVYLGARVVVERKGELLLFAWSKVCDGNKKYSEYLPFTLCIYALPELPFPRVRSEILVQRC